MLNLMSFSPSNFTRYISQTEECTDEPNGINEWTQQSPTIINDIPSLMSISTTAPSPIIIKTTTTTIPAAIMTEDIPLLPFPQHGPGPIQRPTKLTCSSTQQPSSYLTNSIQSPGTPDVFDQINRLLDHQNSTTTTTTTVSLPANINNSSASSTIINDLTTPNIPWTTFSPSEWPSKYDSSWPLTSIQSPTVSLTTQVQNPFALISTINEQQQQQQQQQQPPREETSVWSTVLGTATPRLISSSTRTQRASTWNEIFSSAVPSSTESTKPTNNSWLKFWSAPDPSSSVDGTSPNGHETETINPFWNLSTLSNEPVVSSSTQNQQQTSPSTWWSNASSDENNNKNQSNHLNNDTTNNRDQSRWDFAR
jgi:hypothetical protein